MEREMTLTISLTPEEERQLADRAAHAGQDLVTFVHRLIARELGTPISRPVPQTPSGPTLAEILAPVHEDFRRSGMTEVDLDSLVEEVREDVWRETHGTESRAS
jgi:hypothetical protein